MTSKQGRRLHFSDVLEELKVVIPSPVSSPVADGYVVHTISKFLDAVDTLKTKRPILGGFDGTAGTAAPNFDARAARFPEDRATVEEVVPALTRFCEGMTIWAHPNAQLNVIPPPTLPSIAAFIAASLYSPNLVCDEYSSRFCEAEKEAVAQLADLIGFDPGAAGGLFTFGGTGTLLYAIKLGVEKVLGGQGMEHGIQGENIKVVASKAAHYACATCCSWLGLGSRALVTVPSTSSNEMSIAALEATLRELLDSGAKVAAIIATVGTTDAFGIDDVAAIVRVRDRLVQQYKLSYTPHIHADAVIGWAWAVFNDYPFEENPLGFHARTLRSLSDSLPRIEAIRLADSVGLDFHKTGYTPYISSAVLLKDRSSLALISRDPAAMPYLYQTGHYHPGKFTLETSRPAGGALAAWANIRLLGKQGLRVLIGHAVEMAEMLRERLEQHPDILVLNDYNFGPVTLFRIYSSGVDGRAAFAREFSDEAAAEEVASVNALNKAIFQRVHERVMRGEGVLLSFTAAGGRTRYPGGPSLAAMKSFIISPWTDMKAVATVVEQVVVARAELEAEAAHSGSAAHSGNGNVPCANGVTNGANGGSMGNVVATRCRTALEKAFTMSARVASAAVTNGSEAT